jgi:hypothetical protein
MKQIGRYNNLSEEFIKELNIQPLLPDDRVCFRSTRELTRKGKTGSVEVFYNVSGETIPPTDQIYDTHAKAMIDIGTVLAVDKDGKPERVLKFIMRPNAATGNFYLYGHNEEHQYVYWYLQICNYNKSNKRRFTSKDAIFFDVDETAEANRDNLKSEQLLEVQLYVKRASFQDLKMIALSLGLGDTKSEPMLRKEVREIATRDPYLFEKMMKDTKTVESLSIIKKAFDEGILEWSEVERTVKLANNTIATLARVEGKQKHEQLDEYLKTVKNGSNVYETIKKLVKA